MISLIEGLIHCSDCYQGIEIINIFPNSKLVGLPVLFGWACAEVIDFKTQYL